MASHDRDLTRSKCQSLRLQISNVYSSWFKLKFLSQFYSKAKVLISIYFYCMNHHVRHLLHFSYFSTSVWSHQGATCLCYCKPQTHHCHLELASISSPIGSFGDWIQIHFIPNQQRLYVGKEPGYYCWNRMLKWLGYISAVCFGLFECCGIFPASQRSGWCLCITVCLHLPRAL